MTNFDEYHGIEILRGLYETSLEVLNKFRRRVAPIVKNPPKIELFHGSFLASPTDPNSNSNCSWADADLVFANSTCFPDELIANIAEKCFSLSVGARVITFTTSLRSEYFKVW